LRTLRSALVALVVMPAAALAQGETATPLEDKPALEIRAIERGFFVDAHAGALLLFGPNGEQSGLSPGRTAGAGFGYDLTERLSLSFFATGMHVDTPAGYRSATQLSGDFSTLALGSRVAFALVARPDEAGHNRLFVQLRGGAAYGLPGPKGFFEKSDIIATGGVGLAYYTRLRHFSVGVDLDFVYGLNNAGAGVTLAPHLRYTF